MLEPSLSDALTCHAGSFEPAAQAFSWRETGEVPVTCALSTICLPGATLPGAVELPGRVASTPLCTRVKFRVSVPFGQTRARARYSSPFDWRRSSRAKYPPPPAVGSVGTEKVACRR